MTWKKMNWKTGLKYMKDNYKQHASETHEVMNKGGKTREVSDKTQGEHVSK